MPESLTIKSVFRGAAHGRNPSDFTQYMKTLQYEEGLMTNKRQKASAAQGLKLNTNL